MCESHGHHDGGHHHHHELHDSGPLDGLRVVVTGKGGVGKTSLTALMARLWARRGHRVLALDADPQMNLPFSLGMSASEAHGIIPLSENLDYVEEKTGARPGSNWGGFLRVNPNVDDVVERFGVLAPDGVRLLVMGTIVQPATGCLCPENTLLSGVVREMGLREGEVIVMDTQAGVEHFGRALARGFHHAVIVTDTSFNGAQVALQATRLARAMSIAAVHLVVNRVTDGGDLIRTLGRIGEEGDPPFDSVHVLPYDAGLVASDPEVGPMLPDSPIAEATAGLIGALTQAEERLRPCAS